MTTCMVPECVPNLEAKHGQRIVSGMCLKHYRRWRRHGMADNPPREKPLLVRIMPHVVLDGTCWIYTRGHEGHAGHAYAWTGRTNMHVHRAMWIAINGPIPDGLIVRHKCDVPRCINIGHLELGTPQDNVRDRQERGRHRSALGEQSGKAKLTADQVREIRALQRSPLTRKQIGAAYGIAPGYVDQIWGRKVWRHLTEEPSHG